MSQVSDEPWKWPQYSLRTILTVVTIYAIAVIIAIKRLDEDDAIGMVIGGVVLIWCALGWRFVRLNRSRFVVRRRDR